MCEVSEKYSKAAKELKEVLATETANNIQTMDEKSFRACQICLNFLDAVEEMALKTDRVLDEINRKIDNLGRKQES